MALEIRKPSPKGTWEKVLDSSQFWLLPLALIPAGSLRQTLGFWFSLIVAVGIVVGGTYLCRLPATTQRTRRLENDARAGVFECALRYPAALPGSLRSTWSPGHAEINGGILKFQSDFDLASQRRGSVTVFEDLHPLGRRPLSDRKSLASARMDSVLAVRTGNGDIELAAPAEILQSIEERIRRG